jgi:acyl-CoA hydrolase
VNVPEVQPAELDLKTWIRSGDRIVIGQGAAEPLPLVNAVVDQAAELGDLDLFVGLSYNEVLSRRSPSQNIVSFGAMGALTDLGPEVIPCSYVDLPRFLADGPRAATVVLLQVSPADRDGYHSFGISIDFAAEVLTTARVILAEINDQMPRTNSSVLLHTSQITAAVTTNRPLITAPEQEPSEIDRVVAEQIAELLPTYPALQLGIGALPSAIAGLLADRRGLRIHSALVGDWLLDLVESGAVQIASPDKPAVVGAALGGRELYDFVSREAGVCFTRPADVGSIEVTSQVPGFTAINSALQVDLSGQVNAEVLRGRYVGGTGGQADFLRGAQLAPEGRSIIALPSTAANGQISRIVRHLDGGIVTSLRSSVDFVVTEHGVADLRGATLTERAAALIGVAAPQFRGELASLHSS